MLPDFQETVSLAKDQILEDIKNGRVPSSVGSFSELHDYVDANGYGGAFDVEFGADDAHFNFWNSVQGEIDTWLKQRKEIAAQRVCTIINAGVENEAGQGDGAYDLLDCTGTPEHIGKAIADCLREVDLWNSRYPSAIDAGQELYLTLRIKFCKPQ